MRIKDLRISTQLVAGFALVLILAVSQTFYAIYGMSQVNDNADLIAQRWLPGTRLSGSLDASLNRLRALDYQYVMTFDEGKRRQLEEVLQNTLLRAEEEMADLVRVFSDTDQKDALTALQAGWEKFKAQQENLVKLAQEGNDQDALIVLKEDALEIYEELNRGLTASRTFALDGSDRAQAENAEIRGFVFVGTLVALAVTIALGVLIAVTLTRRIGGGFRHVTQIAMAVAEGDLGTKFKANTRDEFGLLLNSLSHMQQALADLVQRVRRGSDAVSNASVEIAEGNQDLSARTETQASALQQTAATMEELGATVKQNAANAQQANQLARQASTVAEQGGEAVDQVVTMMKSISESSRKINDIINVIDGIAFQTNILALNAAVEAARAGEQGRGFAVVASEVRALAGRSAAAAKEIKELISDSVHRVEQGAATADQAGGTMDEVVAAIKRVSDVVAEISAASVQQSSGVGQVGEAITNMDQATQQNAALVEEMAAAAMSLRSQAQELVEAVAVFKLENHRRETPPNAAALPERKEPDAGTLPGPAQPLLQLAPA